MKFIILIACFLLCSPCMANQLWTAVQNNQSIKFTASYDDIEFNGVFKKFTSTISISPHALTNSFISSTIDVSSIDTNSRDRDQALAESDWFYFSNFPHATFTSTNISLIDTDHYNITGTLQIRDQKKQITFPLIWKITDINHAHASAQFDLDRRDFNIGIGEWAEDETIGFNVIVDISIDYQLE